jgi:hypothetical protein
MLWRVAIHLLKPFRDTMTIWSGGTKSQSGDVTEFYKIRVMAKGLYGQRTWDHDAQQSINTGVLKVDPLCQICIVPH